MFASRNMHSVKLRKWNCETYPCSTAQYSAAESVRFVLVFAMQCLALEPACAWLWIRNPVTRDSWFVIYELYSLASPSLLLPLDADVMAECSVDPIPWNFQHTREYDKKPFCRTPLYDKSSLSVPKRVGLPLPL